MMLPELQLQGLVGPTHNYAGLGLGNVASHQNKGRIANPQKAALQSLEVMRWLQAQDIPIAIFPPQTRPRLDVLKRLGFSGSVSQQLQQAGEKAPQLLRAIWSASSMWAANAATVTAACDSDDRRVHLTPANLFSSLHRMLEAKETTHYLRQIFTAPHHFQVHDPLNVTTRLADEGAANHMRFCHAESTEAWQLFVYGSKPPSSTFPKKNMPRQQYAASEAVMQNHQLDTSHCLFFQQHPDAIDAGVFHHDVIGLSHQSLMVVHEKAFLDQNSVVHQLKVAMPWLHIRQISEQELPLDEAVRSYFFNAQLVSLKDGSTAILFPQESAETVQAEALVRQLEEELPMVSHTVFFDLRESMQNGGGPACLRLRVPLTSDALEAIPESVRFNTKRDHQLTRFIKSRYRDRVSPDDLLDAEFAEEARQTQRDLLSLLGLTPFPLDG